jgi:protein-S-isoprenylcysteine O-methyltransferase Ste14
MKHAVEMISRISLFAISLFLWCWALRTPLSDGMNLSIILGGVLLIFPLVWLGRKMLDRHLTKDGVVWITTFVQFFVASLLGLAIIRAAITHKDWSDWVMPIPIGIGWVLVIITGTACMLTVANLALKGLGAPFYIVLSRRLAVDWFYKWTRNPMVLAVLAFLLSLGIWFQSVLFVLWVLILFAPALLFFVKVYEERELEFRFGASYMEYKSRTPMLFPGKPKG